MHRYKPYWCDWRFLPERVLVAKDYTRHYLLESGRRLPRSLTKSIERGVDRQLIKKIETCGFIFIHIPKTGGTALSSVVYGRRTNHRSFSCFAELFPEFLARYPTFSVVRNPIERMVSAYHFLREGGTELVAADRYDPFGIRKCSSFEMFVDLISSQKEALRLYDPLKTQSSFLVDKNERIAVGAIFEMSSQRGFNVKMLQMLDITHVPRMNITNSPRIAVIPTVRKLIEDIYAEDMVLYEKVMRNDGALLDPALLVTNK